jgi:8-oxo-dGTP diphosphatase
MLVGSVTIAEVPMNVRGIEIETRRCAPQSAGAEMSLSDDASTHPGGSRPDESSVRAACATALVEAQERGVSTVALPSFGVRGGMSPVIAGKIIVQEAIRVARGGRIPRLNRIILCCDEPAAWEPFSRTVDGYLRHLLDVLIWGPFVTVDAIIKVAAGIVLVKRSNPPLGFALPGGFVDYGESLEEAVRREASEETGLELRDLRQFHTYSDPSRDARFHTITTVFSARAQGVPKAGDDAAGVQIVTAAEINGLQFAFDHRQVLGDWLTSRRME